MDPHTPYYPWRRHDEDEEDDVTVRAAVDDEVAPMVADDVSTARGSDDTAAKLSLGIEKLEIVDDVTGTNTGNDVTVPAVGSGDGTIVPAAAASGELEAAAGDTRALTPAARSGSVVEQAQGMSVQGDVRGDMNIAKTMSIKNTVNITINMKRPHSRINNTINMKRPRFTPSLSPDDFSGYNVLKEHSEMEIQLGALVFTPTEAFRRALPLLLDHGMLIITGPRSSGKTSIATALLRHHQGDWTPLVLRTYTEFKRHVQKSRRQVVLLDDIFGSELIPYSKFQKWSKATEMLQELCRLGECLAVITITNGVYADLRAKYNLDKVLGPCPVVDTLTLISESCSPRAESLGKELLDAAQEGDVERLLELLQRGADPNCSCSQGATPLLLAARAGHVRVMRALLVHGADVDAVDTQLWTALHYASSAGREDVASLLLERGACLDMATRDGWSAVHLAASKGHLPVLRLLLHQKADLHSRTLSGQTALHVARLLSVVRALVEGGADPQVADSEGRTPLHEACFHGALDICDFLVQSGASLEATDKLRKTPLHVACEEGNATMVQFLIDRGAHSHATAMFDCYSLQMQVLMKNYPESEVTATLGDGVLEKVTAQYFCCFKGHSDVVSVLLQAGETMDSLEALLCIASLMGHHSIVSILLDRQADVEAEHNDDMRPLHYACQNGHHQVVSLLLDRQADVEAEDKDACRPLHFACQNGHHQVVSLLLDRQADVEAEDKDACRPLHFACQNGHHQVVSLLLDRQADVEAENKDSVRPLHYACKNGDHQVMSMLLNRQADVEAEDKDGMRPLHFACTNGDHQVVSMLLNRQADVEAENRYYGMRPLHYACYNGYHQVVSMLLNRQADVEAENIDGVRPLHFACLNGPHQVFSLLLDRQADVVAEDKDGVRLLHVPCLNGHYQVVSLLLDRQADVNAEDKDGWQPLDFALSFFVRVRT